MKDESDESDRSEGKNAWSEGGVEDGAEEQDLSGLNEIKLD